MIEKLQPDTNTAPPASEPRVCPLDSESATTTIDAIASDTSREILARLHEEPLPSSTLADALDTSIPTVNYHLENLETAGLVEQVDTRYSEKGKEMKLYAPVEDPLVFVGTEEETDRVRSLLSRVAGAFGLLVVGSLLVQWLVTGLLLPSGTAIRKAAPAGTVEGGALTTLPPGLLFFSGGAFVLASVVLLWYVAATLRA